MHLDRHGSQGSGHAEATLLWGFGRDGQGAELTQLVFSADRMNVKSRARGVFEAPGTQIALIPLRATPARPALLLSVTRVHAKMTKSREEVSAPQEWLRHLADEPDGYSRLIRESGGMARAAYRLAQARCSVESAP